jgi:ribosomal protein L29
MDYTREQLEAMTEEELDEIVHDLKAEEAAEINNRGKEAQVECIVG